MVKPDQAYKYPAFFIDLFDQALFFLHKYNHPGHDQHEDGSDCRAQGGIDPLHAHLSQYRRQAGKHRGQKSIDEPRPAFNLFLLLLPFSES